MMILVRFGSDGTGTGSGSMRPRPEGGGPVRPLDGYRVVELGMWVAAPAAAALLGDWGADVVKVESPVGDPNRYTLKHVGQDVEGSPPFETDNRAKRGVVLDLRTDEGRAALGDLLERADAFITNLR